VQVPGASKVIVAPFVPPAEHTKGVVVENVTGRPELEDATAETGDCSSVTSPSASNVIV
jgi:hypothetical protein